MVWERSRSGPLIQKVYCYGSTRRCLWNSNACVNDLDCDKYKDDPDKRDGTILKYTDGSGFDTRNCGGVNVTFADDWKYDACMPTGA